MSSITGYTGLQDKCITGSGVPLNSLPPGVGLELSVSGPDNTVFHVDMNVLSKFASEPDIAENTIQLDSAQPTSIVGRLFRIIGAAFGTSNISIYNSSNSNTEHKV